MTWFSVTAQIGQGLISRKGSRVSQFSECTVPCCREKSVHVYISLSYFLSISLTFCSFVMWNLFALSFFWFSYLSFERMVYVTAGKFIFKISTICFRPFGPISVFNCTSLNVNWRRGWRSGQLKFGVGRKYPEGETNIGKFLLFNYCQFELMKLISKKHFLRLGFKSMIFTYIYRISLKYSTNMFFFSFRRLNDFICLNHLSRLWTKQ